MRLVSQVERLEGSARKRRRVGMIWSRDELKLSRQLADGERLAVDLCVAVPEVAPGDDPEEPQHAVISQSRERATRDPLDLGDVFDGAGALIGKVYDVIPGTVPLVYWCDPASAERLRARIGEGRGGLMSGGSGRR